MRAPRSLRARLLLANLVVAGAVLGAVVVVVGLVGPGYFVGSMGHQPGDPMGSMMASATSAAFDEAMRDALLVGGLIAIVTSIVVSVLISGAIAGPVLRQPLPAHAGPSDPADVSLAQSGEADRRGSRHRSRLALPGLAPRATRRPTR